MFCERTHLPKVFGKLNVLSYVRQSVALLLCAILLSSCGPVLSYFDQENDTSGSVASPSVSAPDSGSSETSGIVMPPMTGGPPGGAIRPLKPGQSGTAYTENGLPALQPARGVNIDELFAEPIKDPDRRIERVENAVIDIRRDLDAIMPSVIRLVAVEDDMNDLIRQLETLLRREPPSRPAAPSAAAEMPAERVTPPPQTRTESPSQTAPPQEKAKPPPTPVTPAKTAANASGGKTASGAPPGSVQVQNLRIGEHGGKTRLVFDLSRATSYRYDLDNNEKLLIVELPDAAWTGQKQWSSSKAPLLASYSVQAMDNGIGSRVIVQLKRPATVMYEDTLTGPPRIVIDVAGN